MGYHFLFSSILLYFASTQLHLVTAHIIRINAVRSSISGEGRFPFMALLQYSASASGTYVSTCSGTLYNSSVVITAGHCIIDTLTKYRVLVNEYDQTKDEEVETDYRISRVVVHPYPEADIALLFLSKKAQGTTTIVRSIAKLADTFPTASHGVTVISWGQNQSSSATGTPSYSLKEMTLQVKPIDVCLQDLGIQNNTKSSKDKYFCGELNLSNNQSSTSNGCSGNNGGPILLMDENSNEWQLLGVVSAGDDGCPLDKQYAFHTSIPALTPWIQGEMASEDFLLLSVASNSSGGIYQVNSLNGNRKRLPLNTSPRGLSYNSEDKRVIWSASRYGVVASSKLDGTKQKIAVIHASGCANSMAYDAADNSIYYNERDNIKSYSFDRNDTRTHIVDAFALGQLTVNVRTRMLYYVTRSSSSNNIVGEYNLMTGIKRHLFQLPGTRDDYIQGLAVSQTGEVLIACKVSRKYNTMNSVYYKFDINSESIESLGEGKGQKCHRLALRGNELFILDQLGERLLVANWVDTQHGGRVFIMNTLTSNLGLVQDLTFVTTR